MFLSTNQLSNILTKKMSEIEMVCDDRLRQHAQRLYNHRGRHVHNDHVVVLVGDWRRNYLDWCR